MPTLVFNTYDYIKKLSNVGVPEEQAAIHAETLAGLINEELATKRDIKELELAMKHDIKELEVAMKHDIKQLEVATKRDIKELALATKRDIKELALATKHDIKELQLSIDAKMAELKTDMIKWVIGIFAAQAALIVTLVKFIK